MKRILIILFSLITLSSYSQIVADHRAVIEFDSIPAAWIDSVKTMLTWIDGESHSYGYRIGLTELETADATYDVTTAWGFPDHYDDAHLRIGADVSTIGEEEWFTWKAYESDVPSENRYIKNRLLTQVAADNPIHALGFAWCWDMTEENGPTATADPVLGVHWWGASVGGPDGNNEWGIDAEDIAQTSNSVSLQTYFEAMQDYIDFCADSSNQTTVVYTTGPVDLRTGEQGYQQHLKYEAIRDYVNADTNRVLFDYADILCWDDNGDSTMTTWTTYDYPVITTTNLGAGDVGHIGAAGRLRLAKAQWWLLARIAGWEGVEQIYEADYYVAPDGDDSNPGTYAEPWGTWQKAFETADAGDTVYFRGGVWYPQDYFAHWANSVCIIAPDTAWGLYTGQMHGNNGISFSNQIYYFNYPGEFPILDCSQVDTSGHKYNTGIDMYLADYIHFRGLTVRNVYQTKYWDENNPQDTTAKIASGIGPYGCSNLTFENCTVHDIGGRGFSMSSMTGYFGIVSDTTKWINCDVYNCYDPLSTIPGNGADGFKTDAEDGGFFLMSGCRIYNCSDDGIDMSGSSLTIYENTWSFLNGGVNAIDGNGLKFGANRGIGSYIDENGNLVRGPVNPGVKRIVRNTITAFNKNIGLYDLEYPDYYRNDSRVYNNISWGNGTGIQISTNWEFPESLSQYYNNVVYKTKSRDAGNRPANLTVQSFYTESNNSWDYADSSVVGSLYWWIPAVDIVPSDADYIETDSATIIAQLKAPRNPDGSLPIQNLTAFRLALGSEMIGAGTYVGMSANPDVGLDFDWLESQLQVDSSANDITSFAISGQTGSSTINATNHTVTLTMPSDTDRSSLSATISVSPLAVIAPPSGTLRDFLTPQVYIVTSADQTGQVWTVTVNLGSAPHSGEQLRYGKQVKIGKTTKFNGKYLLINVE